MKSHRSSGSETDLNNKIRIIVNEITEYGLDIYKYLHQYPELSQLEKNTSARLANELSRLGFEVTTNIGGTGVVGILRNGEGSVVMLRTDMDALPVKENTGLLFASTVVMKDAYGNENPVMHACGHDVHMSSWLGAMRTLASLKDEWQGTVMALAQPAEEVFIGARAMLNDGLFKKFPVPDYSLFYHVNPEMPAGTIGYYAGPILAGEVSATITIHGIGGHGAMPHKTIDPIVIASRIVLDIQTIVSREINPVKSAVVSVGAINGGNKTNIIPDEVKMLLTIRYFENEVLQSIKKSLMKITRGAAITAGLPESKMPEVIFNENENPPVSNDPVLVMAAVDAMKDILGDKNIIRVNQSTGSEDFGQFGQTGKPLAIFWLGSVNPEKYEDYLRHGTHLPPLHNSEFAPDFIPAFQTGVAAMTKTVITLLSNKK
jgi:amidohydrolase